MATRPLRGETRRTMLKAAAGAIAAPALLRAGPAEAALAPDAGSMLIIGFDGVSAAGHSARALAEAMRHGWAGGVMFHARNIGDREDFRGLVELFDGTGRRPLLAVDQEGGDVQRLGPAQEFTRFPRARNVASTMTVEEAAALYAAAGAQLRDIGVNFNLAPVADLDDPGNPIIGAYGRAFSADPAIVAQYAAAAIAGFASAGILTAAKHFPGHGHSLGDTHEGFVDITSTFQLAELLPFRDLVAAGRTPAVMVGHLAHRYFGYAPASLSPLAIDGLLRGILGYRGVVITDDLDMDAIRNLMSLEDAVIASAAAGNDLIILSNSVDNDPDLARKAVNWLVRAAVDGRLPRSRITESAARVRQLKALLPAEAEETD
ncbi:MAG: glycoside hydrolase family 3 protein [Bauldia sp.]|nr:glycoside hydrolase family 3 protein [Bauldia sp.]